MNEGLSMLKTSILSKLIYKLHSILIKMSAMFYWGKLTHLKKLYEKVKAEKSQDKHEKRAKLEELNK